MGKQPLRSKLTCLLLLGNNRKTKTCQSDTPPFPGSFITSELLTKILGPCRLELAFVDSFHRVQLNTARSEFLKLQKSVAGRQRYQDNFNFFMRAFFNEKIDIEQLRMIVTS